MNNERSSSKPEKTPSSEGVLIGWTISGGKFQKPDPEEFSRRINDLRPDQDSEVTIRTILYALERCGRLLTPQEYNKPLIDITAGMAADERAKLVDDFMAYAEFLDAVYEQVVAAFSLAKSYSFTQLTKELPASTKQATPDRIQAIGVIDAMHSSSDDAFRRIGPQCRKMAIATLRIIYAWENKDRLPELKTSADSTES